MQGGSNSTAPAFEEPRQKNEDNHELEEMLGFPLLREGTRLGWLMNLNSTTLEEKESGNTVAAVNCYFMSQDGSMFKAQVPFSPYFYLQIKGDMEAEVDAYLRRKYTTAIRDVETVFREDLDLKNHLSGLKRKLLKVSFWTVQQLMDVKRDLMPALRRNRTKADTTDAYSSFAQDGQKSSANRLQDALDALVDMREYDVPYHMRFQIDTDVRCGLWYDVRAKGGKVSLEPRPDLLQRAEPRICAFDIETTKLPLQFPNAEYDQVFMISYMIDKQGYLIINREVVGGDIESFEYTPKPEFVGPFEVWNEANEEAMLRRWFDHMRQVKPAIYVTYNGDFFDWPFMETRAAKLGMDMHQEIGFKMNSKTHECLSRFAVHMDCMHWVNRDSYLPQGSRGLKAVTRAKLGYNPIEVDPEDMLRFAAEQPQTMASYSVSDAVATFYLYMTYIHPFIFSLSTIIPMPPDEVLRKGSGTLCEMLLMVQAFKANVVAPNKHTQVQEPMFRGHLLESETYIGGKVEALESGVFRSDLPTRFKLDAAAYQELIDSLDDDLRYAIEVEGKLAMEDVENYEEVRDAIKEALEGLRDTPNREECPLIYHLDVAAMYPNIILTNRLQPSAIVTDEDCAACDFNRPGKTCLRTMTWEWRGETFAATSTEYFSIKNQLESERFAPETVGSPPRYYGQLPHEERAKLLKERLKKYCQRVYKRVLDKPVTEAREAGVCMRENDFYVGTVLSFRDRRYEYKGLNKSWKGRLDTAKAEGNPIRVQEAADMVVLYDSLQLAHKCILNSFYGYVMRKGARWYSMEMAGVVTYTGARIIQRAAELVRKIGTRLELDTDGIWCALPASFPENFKFKSRKGKDLRISYPCVVLNVMVAQHNTNDQYQTLADGASKRYETSSRMSIEFEVDGPYKAMILPASKEEGKLIKKRYAVFNPDGTLAELKGFELKRRGELKLIKVFQSEVFEQFLAGDTLEECYAAVAAVADRWLDLLDTQGTDVTDEELLEYISESSTMSKAMDEYEGRKSCAITTAKRLAQFLGDERIKDKGLNCNYVIAKRPENQPTSERAIPVAIFSTEPSVARSFLRRWCGHLSSGRSADEVPDVRAIVDWDYYRERLGSAIQKIITIPAAMQRVANPVPRVKHPDWLHKKVREKDDRHQQKKLDGFLRPRAELDAAAGASTAPDVDMEDMGTGRLAAAPGQRVAKATTLQRERETDRENRGDAHNRPAGPSGAAASQAAEEEEEDLGPCPNRKEDPLGWLRHQKRRWRAAATLRKKRRLDAARERDRGWDSQPQAAPRGADVGAFFRAQAEQATHSHWQVVHIAPTSTPGVFKAWVLVAARLYAVPLRVPRTFYVNSTCAPTDADSPAQTLGGLKVQRTLPFGRETFHLYQVTIAEDEFRRREADVTYALSQPHVRDVWEERMPLALDAALAVGCVAAVAPAVRSRPLSEGFDLTDLQSKTTTECSYLEERAPDGGSLLRHVALFASQDTSRGRAVYGLHLAPTKRCLLVVVNPAAGAGSREVSIPAAERHWHEAHVSGPAAPDAEDGGRSSQQPIAVPEIEFGIAYVRTAAEAARAVQNALLQLRERHRGPLMVVAEVPGGVERLTRDMPLLAEFPTCQVPAHSADGVYPSLGWQPKAARTAVMRLAAAGPWFQDRIELARYAHLPLGNLGGDWMLDVADAHLARCLRDAGHVLWISDPSLPDVAGRADDDAEDDLALFEPAPLEVVNAGAHRCVCVQLKLYHLAVAAVEKCEALAELEGAASVGPAPGAGPAFKVLKQLVHNWLLDTVQTGNRFSDALLTNLWRWLCSPAAALGCAGLQRTVQGLMRKTLAQLVADLKRLGARVVAADAHSLILATSKHNLTAAVGYVDYLLDAVGKRELFSLLRMELERFWHSLLFRDRYNYFGILADIPAQLQDSLTQHPGALTQGGAAELHVPEPDEAALEAPAFDHIWTIKDYLPPKVHEAFLSTLTEFVLLPWREAMRASVEGASQGGSQAVAEARGAAAAQEAWLKANMGAHFSRKLLGVVKRIERHMGPHDGDASHQFPRLAGSYLSEEELGTPALAFVRAVCDALRLDPSVEEEVLVLRRNLLLLTHTLEFAPAAEFREPCRSFVLRNVICSYCNDCTDLDLCRDPALQEHQWSCRKCGCAYELATIEAQLLRSVRLRARAYQLQDLRCLKCRQVLQGHLRRNCDQCGGTLRTTEPAAAFTDALTVFRNVATYHGFQLLQDATEWLLQMPSAAH
ncbi:g3725 [Coccomyxa elongata]